MGTIRKRVNKKGVVSWQALVRKQGINETKTFKFKRDADFWVNDIERAIEIGEYGKDTTSYTFEEILIRYRDEVLPQKKSAKNERYRLNAFLRDFTRLTKKDVHDITRADIAYWKETRLKSIKNASVRREWNTLSAAYNHAYKVWGYDLPDNPFKQLKRPAKGKARQRRITVEEIEKIIKALGYKRGERPESKKQLTAWAFLFAIETGMRASEILKLQPDDIQGKLAYLHDTKNTEDRAVTLSQEARALLALVDLPLNITSGVLDSTFRANKPKDIEDLRFHDTRHEALSRLAKIIPNPMDLAKISGHKDINILLNTYYNTTHDDLSSLLD